MLQTAFQKFSGGCMMVMRTDRDVVQFLGTAFLVHNEGYLLTAAHVLPKNDQVMVVPHIDDTGFLPLSLDRVSPLTARVISTDSERDVALIKLEQDLGISLPDHFLGSTDDLLSGSSVMAMGFSFGHQQLHTLIALNGVVSAKVSSQNSSKLILFDRMIHDGDRGGPLVSISDGLVVGILNGRFDPVEASREYTDGSRTVSATTNMSYAVAIEYGIALMEQEGLTPG